MQLLLDLTNNTVYAIYQVKCGKKDLHETKRIEQTLNPVYSPETNSFFVCDESPKEVRARGGLVFKIKDWDRVGKNDDLGQVVVDAETLYAASGENLELKITPPKNYGDSAGYLTIRVRPATSADRAQKTGLMTKMFSKAMAPSKDYGPHDLSLLIEVVSCWNLPKADVSCKHSSTGNSLVDLHTSKFLTFFKCPQRRLPRRTRTSKCYSDQEVSTKPNESIILVTRFTPSKPTPSSSSMWQPERLLKTEE